MGKKRKSSRSGLTDLKTKPNEEEAAPAARYDRDETFADPQDEFFAGKDQIMLEEGPSRKRRKQIEEEDRYLEPSDEEVLGYDEEDLSDDDLESANDENRSESEAEDGIQDWGTSKADYYDADIIETEADALEEEAEARRLQQKQLQSMTEADFGFDESEWVQPEDEQDASRGVILEKLPEVAVTEEMPAIERLKILKSRYPELEPLAKDYSKLSPLLEHLGLSAKVTTSNTSQISKKRKAGQDTPAVTVCVAELKWRALSTYLGSIAMYFAMLTASASGMSEATAPMPPAELRQHPVMQSLLKSRQSWDAVKDLQVPETHAAAKDLDAPPEHIPIELHVPIIAQEAPRPTLNVLELGKKANKVKKGKTDGERSAKTKKRARKDAGEGGVLAELDNLIASVKKPSTVEASTPADEEDDSDFGDEAALTVVEAAEKAQRKKGLRFYTSQLAQKSNKRGAASRDAGGDADLPYKERLKDRQTRLMREAERRGGEKAKLEQRLDYRDEDDNDEEEMANHVRGTAKTEDGNEYYQTISRKTHDKKADKAARAAAHAEAAKVDGQVFVEDVVGPDGKRGITYEISKNKGLMPRRKKEVRNPRVKKRMKYDQKLKKLGSIRQVYKGGEAKGGYGGELSGIKTNVVRSVKL